MRTMKSEQQRLAQPFVARASGQMTQRRLVQQHALRDADVPYDVGCSPVVAHRLLEPLDEPDAPCSPRMDLRYRRTLRKQRDVQ
ncbi:hypothetical protein WT06_31145 [Burkholderia anthina]|nr:hypothetical protein WT06_31145 [Burkholderia anthina]